MTGILVAAVALLVSLLPQGGAEVRLLEPGKPAERSLRFLRRLAAPARHVTIRRTRVTTPSRRRSKETSDLIAFLRAL
jgi:hypothetical protein